MAKDHACNVHTFCVFISSGTLTTFNLLSIGSSEGIYMDGTFVPSPKEFYPDGIPEIFSMSRSAYETLLRRLVVRIPNVRFIKGNVTGVTPSAGDSKRLDSVTYRSTDDPKALSVQKAQLVIGAHSPSLPQLCQIKSFSQCATDCSGSSHAGYTWLKRANFSTPVKEVYNPHLRYYTTEFSVDPTIMSKILPHGFDPSVPFIIVNANHLDNEERALAITQIENNRSQCFSLELNERNHS